MSERLGVWQEQKEIDPTTEIVVIGMGAVTPLGLTVDSTWRNLTEGKSGIRSKRYEEYPKIKASVAATVCEFDAEEVLRGVLPLKEIRKNLHPAALYALAATHQALREAGLIIPRMRVDEKEEREWCIDRGKIDPEDVAVILGTGVGGTPVFAQVQRNLDTRGRAEVPDILKALPERMAKDITIAYGIHGSSHVVSDACASGNKAISSAIKEIRCGDAKIVVTGASEAACVAVGTAPFEVIRALDLEPDPNRASRPLDKSAGGFVMGEGAVTLILADLATARVIGAPILARIISYKDNSDANDNVFPDQTGEERAIRGAINRAGWDSLRAIYINGHLTATGGDKVEMLAIRSVFSERQKQVVGVSGTKGATGHFLGAAGALEAMFCVQALRTGIVPPTLKLVDPIDEAQGFNCVPGESQQLNPEAAINNSFGFGGGSSVLTFKKY